MRADTQRLHQAGVSLSLEGGGLRGGGGGAGERSARRGRGDGQGHGAGLLLHPLDTMQNTSEQGQIVTFLRCRLFQASPAGVCHTYCAMFQALQKAATEGGSLSMNKGQD